MPVGIATTLEEMTRLAEKAEMAAQAAHSEEEREAFVRIAQVWREMASRTQNAQD